MATQDIVQQLKAEGRAEGRHEGRHEARQKDLLTIYRARFRSVPRTVREAVERTRDDAALARWVKIFAIRSAAEIVTVVAEKKAWPSARWLHPEDEEFLMATEGIVQQLKDEGRREGRHEAGQKDLLTIYRTRFGSVPRKVRAAVERTRDDAALARWVGIFAVRSTAEIAAAVDEKPA